MPIHLHAPGHHKLVELSSFACSRKRGLCLVAGALQGVARDRCAGDDVMPAILVWGSVALLPEGLIPNPGTYTTVTGMILQVGYHFGGYQPSESTNPEATHRVLHMQEDDVIQVRKKRRKTNT